ncbi:hypothetical protein BACCIP111895_01259 [Neobacillus rhizosphaerae]|uniref:DUF4190 domain-containing protein n=1 Tax=Neobacillus rhizosphaerae TaxID=2880965 RepID=A0ABN8KNB0_9BACI|nr:hypothetical protein [Neobacillus rhizosphaerae]CAH2714105.1 hypothetical protein BACCIP111895_01259 [Neobacillus rhizosphaerae]
MKFQQLVPKIGFLLFLSGIWLGSMVHPGLGILSIFGGLLIGFGYSNEPPKSRALYYGSFFFLFVLFTGTYLFMITIILD